MDISSFRRIGKQLLQEIPLFRQKPLSQVPLGIGASGDKTFPIDKHAEDIIISALAASGEPLTIISEEMGIADIHGGGKKILIDPIDGSKNAIAGIPFYCTSIAVADGNTIGDIELAYILNLISGDEFWAEKGAGAFLNGEPVSPQKTRDFSLIAYEAQSPKKDIPAIQPLLSKSQKTRCYGSTALDLAHVACGSISVFANPSFSRSFDFGAGWLIVREAGGVCTDIYGQSIEKTEISIKKSVSLLASGNELLHAEALRSLGRDF